MVVATVTVMATLRSDGGNSQTTYPDFLSRECFRHCCQLWVSKQLLSITFLPSRGVGSQIPGLRLLLKSLPIAYSSLEPLHCPSCPMGISPPHYRVSPWASTPCRLLWCCGPQSLSPAQRPPLSVPASLSQLCKSSLGIWFVSSWQCHSPPNVIACRNL